MKRHGKLSAESFLRRDMPIVPSEASEPHWACPDCGMPCYCADELVRRSPHVACGTPADPHQWEYRYHD